MRGKNKLVPRLLGVTKESILRVDEKTKEVSRLDFLVSNTLIRGCERLEAIHSIAVQSGIIFHFKSNQIFADFPD